MSSITDSDGRDTCNSWLDKKFMENLLRREENDDDLTVRDMDVQSAVPKGDNYASLLLRVNVEYDTADQLEKNKPQKRSLIVKTLPIGEMMQLFVTTIGFFEKESHMYEVTLPEIYELVEDVTGTECEHIATDILPVERTHTIVLKDMRPDGYKMADRKHGLDVPHSIKAIRTLARLHAYSMALFKKDPSSMDFYKESFYIEENHKMLSDFMVTTFNSLATEVKTWEGFERYSEKIQTVAATSVDRTIEMVKHKPGALRVLNHGDFWTNNMMFRYEDGEIADVKIVDFQMVRFASPGLDLQYFLHTSPSQAILEDNWDLLVGEYHDGLCETLKMLDYGEEVTLDQIYQELKDKEFFGVVTSCMFCIMVAEQEDAPDLSNITEENMETVGASSMNKAFAGKRFRAAFERRLPKFETRGLI